jgi:hypothetical protein
MIFSLDLSSTIPLSIITEHSFGVRSLAFSPDSQFLASLGDMNDGFLFVWHINSKTGSARLHSTNKCTSSIHDMTWIGSSLITYVSRLILREYTNCTNLCTSRVGTRHVKVWRISDGSSSPSKSQRAIVDNQGTPSNSSPRALVGRNCLLGSLADSIFTCVSPLSDQEAIVCTDRGSICLLDDKECNQKLTLLASVEFGIRSIICDLPTRDIWVGDNDGIIHNFTIESLIARAVRPTELAESETLGSSSFQTAKGNGIVGLGLIDDYLISLDSSRTITTRKAILDQHQAPKDILPAHNEPVLGIGILSDRNRSYRNADFFTWSTGGQVNFWDLNGNCLDSLKISVEQLSTTFDEVCNELRVLRISEDMTFFVSGDRYGVVKSVDHSTPLTTWEVLTLVYHKTDDRISSLSHP